MLLVQETVLVETRLVLGWPRTSEPPANKSPSPRPPSSVMDLDDVDEEDEVEEEEDDDVAEDVEEDEE